MTHAVHIEISADDAGDTRGVLNDLFAQVFLFRIRRERVEGACFRDGEGCRIAIYSSGGCKYNAIDAFVLSDFYKCLCGEHIVCVVLFRADKRFFNRREPRKMDDGAMRGQKRV